MPPRIDLYLFSLHCTCLLRVMPASRTAYVTRPQNSAARAALAEDNFNLEGRIMGELKQMEEESARINSQIEEVRWERRGAGGESAAGRPGLYA